MNKLVENCLYTKNPQEFQTVKIETTKFCKEFVGSNIIRSAIFNIISDYCDKKGHNVKILYLPIKDNRVWAFTTVVEDCIFVTINTSLPRLKQLFAGAHEFYHIKSYIEAKDNNLLVNGSLLTENDSTYLVDTDEDMKANAFAGLILAPETQLKEQVGIYLEDKESLDFILFCCERFGLPYKAMILRLYETNCLTKNIVDSLLNREDEFYSMAIIKSNSPDLFVPSLENNIDQLIKMVNQNKNMSFITKEKADYDLEKLNKIKKEFEKSENA